MQQEDTQPWYRQFWPWFLISLPAAAVVAGLYTLALAVNTKDSLVVGTDRSISAAKERVLAAERRARDLELEAHIAINLQTGLITAKLAAISAPDAPGSLQLEFSHPAFAERDQLLALARALPDEKGTPTWSGHFPTLPSGRWYVVLQSADDWRLNGVWSGEPELTRRPASADGR